MSVQQNLIAGVCVAIGIASVGVSLKAGIDHFVDRDRVVTVKGLAERNVQADYVIWPVTRSMKKRKHKAKKSETF